MCHGQNIVDEHGLPACHPPTNKQCAVTVALNKCHWLIANDDTFQMIPWSTWQQKDIISYKMLRIPKDITVSLGSSPFSHAFPLVLCDVSIYAGVFPGHLPSSSRGTLPPSVPGASWQSLRWTCYFCMDPWPLSEKD